MQSSSRKITSNQSGIHQDLQLIVERHIKNPFQKPITEFNKDAFKAAEPYYQRYQDNLILDSGCGVGESTFNLARAYPESFIIGIDQSASRINCNNDWELPDNALLLRADLVDFWRLAALSGWKLQHHFLLYPNPWPKKKHLQRRWHGHPVFPVLKQLGGVLELRTNWKIYAEEFSEAITLLTGGDHHIQAWKPEKPITPFERKYQGSGQDLYRFNVDLG